MQSNQLKPQEEFSFGTAPLMKAIEQCISSHTELIDVVCLNLGTIVRNCMGNTSVKEAIENDRQLGIKTDKPAQVLVNEAKTEAIHVVSDICQMFKNNGYIDLPYIVTYHSDYSKSIPNIVYKPPVESKYYLTRADSFFRTQAISPTRRMSKIGKCVLIELPIRDQFLPWRHIMVEMKEMRNNHNVLMVSNHPVDYHVGSVSRTFRIARSFVGDIIKYKQLGTVVLHNSIMPFNIYTHALFGDKEDVKCSLSKNDKDTLLDIAKREEWILKTKDFIKDRLYKLGIKIPTTF